jgi:hypothetical protein
MEELINLLFFLIANYHIETAWIDSQCYQQYHEWSFKCCYTYLTRSLCYEQIPRYRCRPHNVLEGLNRIIDSYETSGEMDCNPLFDNDNYPHGRML